MWYVTWRRPDKKKRHSKEFLNEKKARKFYMKLIRSEQAEAQAIFEAPVFEILRRNRLGRWVVEYTLVNRDEAFKLFYRLSCRRDKYKIQAR